LWFFCEFPSEKHQRGINVDDQRRHTGTVNHDGCPSTLLLNGLSSGFDSISFEVGTLGTAPKNDVHICVTTGLDNGSKALFSDAHKGMWIGSRVHGINGDTNTAVGSVLEANGERDTRSKFTMELRFCCASTDGTPGDTC